MAIKTGKGLIILKLTKRLILMAKKYWGTLFIASMGLIGATALNLVTPEIVRRLTFSLQAPEGISVDLLLMYSGILVLTYLIRAVCRFISMSISHLAAWSFVPELTLKVYDKLQELSLKYFQDKQTGQIMSRMINDTRMLEVLIAHALPDLFSNLLIITGVTIMLFSINAKLALLALIPVPFVLLSSVFFTKKVAPLFKINSEVLGNLNGTLQDKLSGIKEIQAFGQEKNEHEKMSGYCKHYSYVNTYANFVAAVFHPTVEFFTSMGTVVVVGLGGVMAMNFQLSVPDIIGFLMYLSLFYQPLTILARLFEDVLSSYASGIRIFEILDAESEVKEKPDAAELKKCEGKISFENVTFGYNKGEDILSDITFTANPGEMIAIVGPTGVGKTTIVSLIERFYDPQNGKIKLDGVDIKDLKLHSLRKNISMVLQDVFLFNGTIAENIGYGASDYSDNDIIETAKISHAHDFIMQMPDKYATLVGERGTRLSGGQKQRIAIARAILRGSPVLILDEATSSVDNETEAEIQQALDELTGTRTIIVIAHRLSTIKKADKILVIKNSRIAEQGNHSELLSKDGIYAKLSNIKA